jgi:transcriptional regulator of acetoin/glycerol metabolism
LLRYPWPLNVRELEQALATAQVLAGSELVRAEHLPDSVRTGRPPGAPRPVVLSENDQKVRDQVVAALREHQGNVSAVARALDKDRKQIQRWIKRFGLDPGSYR